MAFIQFTKEEYLARFGVDLEKEIPGNDDMSAKTPIRIAQITEKIQEYILSKMPHLDFETLTDAQNTYINKACMEQLNYELNEADYSGISGYNAFTGTLTPTNEIAKIEIARTAKRLLANHIISAGWY